MAYGITSSSQLIDIITINDGVQMINSAAAKFEKCADLVLSASKICNEKALSVDKTTMQPQLEHDAEEIRKIKTYIEDYAVEVNNLAVQVLAGQQRELAEYNAKQENSN